VASPAYLDAVGSAARRLERSFDETAPSPFVEAMKQAPMAVDALVLDVETGYKLRLG
jgi:hypothetical protein